MNLKRLGIIGAENSHSVQIAQVCNTLEKVPMRVTHIWGETRELAEAAAQKGQIPKIVGDWRQLLGEVDGIMIDHRDGGLHAEPAEFFIAHGVPTFVDKPITCRLAEAQRLLTLGEKHKNPVLTFSLKTIQQSFRDFARRIRESGRLLALNSSGPGDFKSPWGGIFFYGIHQVEMVVELLGTEAKSAGLQVSGPNALGVVNYGDGRFATLNFLTGAKARFECQAHTEQAMFLLEDKPDEIPYLASAEMIHRLLETREVPFTRERMLAPIAILEAFSKSLASGRTEEIESL